MLLWKITAKFLAVIFLRWGFYAGLEWFWRVATKGFCDFLRWMDFVAGKFPALAPDCVLIFTSFYDYKSKRPSVSGPWKAGFWSNAASVENLPRGGILAFYLK